MIPVTAFQQNCSILSCVRSGQAVVVDPGGDIDRILAAVQASGAQLCKILVTHGHLDHAGAVAALAEQLNLPIEGPQREDKFWIDQIPAQTRQYGMPEGRSFTPGRWLENGDTVTFGEQTLEVLHCPGHTPGHVVFFHRPAQLAIVGDVLFKGSIGRTDFPRGNHAQLLDAIRNRLWPLGNGVRFLPGHGPMSDFGSERRSNPFVGDSVLGPR